MDIRFGSFTFRVDEENRIFLLHNHLKRDDVVASRPEAFSVLEVLGGANCVNAQTYLDTGCDLRYVSHTLQDNVLTVIRRSDKLETESVFVCYENTDAIRVQQTIRNITQQEICLEQADTLTLEFSNDPVGEKRDWFLHRFSNTRYAECMPVVQSFYEVGITCHNSIFREIATGNMSSRLMIPQAILENRKTGQFMMFQIESAHSWHYSLGANRARYYLQLGGMSQLYHAWNKILKPGESYQTVAVTVCGGSSLHEVLANMTRYRRQVKLDQPADRHLPVIYNEYMYCGRLDPHEALTRQVAPAVSKLGAEYYVIDCGWQTDVPGEYEIMYRDFGDWRENRVRFPSGLKAMSQYVESLGMKLGLWIEPEAVGIDRQDLVEFYGEDCFLSRGGQKLRDKVNYLLDFRHEKVRQVMTEVFDRLIKEYGVKYIKFDAVPCAYLGPDNNCTSQGDGLEKHMDAFVAWTKEMIERYPDVVFENCAGGGQRFDQSFMSMFQVVSTSDQTDYALYPYIVGNIFTAILPEQAAIWAYPVHTALYDEALNTGKDAHIHPEHVVLNMVSGILGRYHLSSHLELLGETNSSLIREALAVYNAMTPFKLQSVPYLPKGYSQMDDPFVAVGLKGEKKVYLAVWNLHGDRHVELPLPGLEVADVQVAYPKCLPTAYSFGGANLCIEFTRDEQARLFEIALK